MAFATSFKILSAHCEKRRIDAFSVGRE